MDSFSLRRLDDVLPERLVAWVRWACVVTILGYGVLLALDLRGWRAQEPLGLVGEAGALVLALCSLVLVQRRHAGWAALVLVLAVGAEIHWAIFLDGDLSRGGALVVPVLLLAGGALLGGYWPFVLAASAMVTLPLAVGLGGWRAGDLAGALRAESGNLVVMALVVLATAILLHQAIGGFEGVLELAERRAQRVADLIRHAPDAILVLDEGCRVRVANPAAERLFRRSAEELRGCDFQALGLEPAPDQGGLDDTPRNGVERVLAGSSRPLLLMLNPLAATRRVVEVTSRHTPGSEPRLQVLLRDVTERVEAEAAQRELELRLQHAHRLQAVAVLAGGVAHDFHNLFTVVRGAAELLRLENDPELAALADDLARAQERGSMLTQKLLSFARLDDARPAPVSLAEVVRQAEPFLKSVLGDAARLELRLEAPAWTVGDTSQLDQLLAHLVSNARDAQARHVTILVSEQAPWLTLAVQDDGHGMDPRTRDRMFDPFFTTKPQGAGSGLSLSSVLGTVERYGGFVSVDTAPGRGTTLTIRLPLADPEPAVAPGLGTSPPDG